MQIVTGPGLIAPPDLILVAGFGNHLSPTAALEVVQVLNYVPWLERGKINGTIQNVGTKHVSFVEISSQVKYD